jgi:hypothetical protein
MTSALFYWEDPVASAVLFTSVLGIYDPTHIIARAIFYFPYLIFLIKILLFSVTLVSFSYYSLISVVSYSALFLLGGVGAVKLYSKVMVMLGKAAQGSDPLEKVGYIT